MAPNEDMAPNDQALASQLALNCRLSDDTMTSASPERHVSADEQAKAAVVETHVKSAEFDKMQEGEGDIAASKEEQNEVVETALTSPSLETAVPASEVDRNPSDDDDSPVLDKFTVFKDLPTELRIKIIKASLPKWRNVKVELRSRGDKAKPTYYFHSKNGTPVILHVNSEFRQVALKYYEKLGSGNWLPNTYVNLEKDIFELSELKIVSPWELDRHRNNFKKHVQAPGVQRLVLRWTIMWERWIPSYTCPDRRIDLSDIAHAFPDLRELWFEYPLKEKCYCQKEGVDINEPVMVDVERYPYLPPRIFEMNKSIRTELEILKRQRPDWKLETLGFVTWAINSPAPPAAPAPLDDETCLDMKDVKDVNDSGVSTMGELELLSHDDVQEVLDSLSFPFFPSLSPDHDEPVISWQGATPPGDLVDQL